MGVRLFSPRVSQGEGEPAPSRFPLGREAAALLLLATAVYLTLALASLEPPAAGLEDADGNWVGPVGAWLAQPVAGLLEPGERHWDILRGLTQQGQTSGPLVMDAITWARAKDLIAEVLTRPVDERDEYDIADGPTVPEINVTRDPDIEMWDK